MNNDRFLRRTGRTPCALVDVVETEPRTCRKRYTHTDGHKVYDSTFRECYRQISTAYVQYVAIARNPSQKRTKRQLLRVHEIVKINRAILELEIL